MKRGNAFVLFCGVVCGLYAAELKTPETSKLFVRHEDPQTGVVSYLLKPELVAFNQQSLYFTAKSMTDDGRFIVFWASDDEFPPERKGKRLGVSKRMTLIDLLKEEIVDLGVGGCIPWIDVATDQMWYTDKAGVHRRDLLVDPRKDHLLCAWPDELVCKNPKASPRYGTHITLSPDRRLVFMDACIDFQDVEGVIDTATGKWTEWARSNFCCNHGQFNPVDPSLAMCAWESARFKTRDEMYPDEIARAKFSASGYVSDLVRSPDDVYPRLWLFRQGKKWEVTSKITNYASHEYFTEDGKGFYWCSSGVCYHDLATGRQWRINPLASAHATMTADNTCIVSDCSWGGWWRGCGWTVLFWNRETHRGLFIHSKIPVIAPKSNESRLHPDPHPQFVCRDRYIICTMNDEARRMNLSVTPVAPLLARTTDPATAPKPKTFPLAFDPAARTDATYELQIDVAALRAKKLVDPPPCPATYDSYTAFALKGVVDGREQMLPFEAIQGDDFRKNVVLRFKIPAGTEKLFYIADAPGKFEYADSESCANLFAGAYDHENASRWVRSAGTRWTSHRGGLVFSSASPSSVAYESAVSNDLRGRNFKFELDLRNLGEKAWTGGVKLEQIDEKGNPLGDALAGQGTRVSIERDRRGVYRLTGTIDRQTQKVRLVIGLVSKDGAPSKVLVCRLNLREATVFHQ